MLLENANGQWNSFSRAEKKRELKKTPTLTSEKRDKWENYKFNESESLDYFHCNLMRLSNYLAFCLLKNNVERLSFENSTLYFIESMNISYDDNSNKNNNRNGFMLTLFVSQWVIPLNSIHDSCSIYSWTNFHGKQIMQLQL